MTEDSFKVPAGSPIGPRFTPASPPSVKRREEREKKQDQPKDQQQPHDSLSDEERVALGLAIERINRMLDKGNHGLRVGVLTVDDNEEVLIIENTRDGTRKRAFGDRVIKNIDPAHIEAWLTRLEQGGGLLFDGQA